MFYHFPINASMIKTEIQAISFLSIINMELKENCYLEKEYPKTPIILFVHSALLPKVVLKN